MLQHGHFQRNRTSQNWHVFHQAIEEKLRNQFYQDPVIQKKIKQLEEELFNGTLNPYEAATELLNSKNQFTNNK